MELPRPGKTAVAFALTAALWCTPVSAQVVNLIDGPVSVVVKRDLPIDIGLAQSPVQGPESTSGASANAPSADISAPAKGLAFYTANYTSLGGKHLPFNIVGTDPSLGAHTTTIPTVLVPLKFVFPNSGSPTLDGTNIVEVTENSPIFQPADYTAGTIDLGVTQYGDALQRAEFWNLPGFSTDYHVLLGAPSVAATVTVAVPPGKGNAYAVSGGGFMGVVDTFFFRQSVASAIRGYSADQLPIFVTDNVYLAANGVIQNCCIFGYHDSQGPPIATAKTWIYSVHVEDGTFSPSGPAGATSLDAITLSHEVAEWLNDPFVGAFSLGTINLVPPAVLPANSGGGCIVNFETGDPIEGVTFTKTTDSKVYELQDEVLLPWYLHSTPSFSVNGWYTFQNLSATIPLVINGPPAIAGTDTNTATLAFAPANTAVTADVVFIGTGCPTDTYSANPAGKIALIDRGMCAVSLKIDRAVQAGAAGVLIGLVAPGDAFPFGYAGGSTFAPSLVITQATSNSIKNALASPSTVNVTISPANTIPAPFSTLCSPG